MVYTYHLDLIERRTATAQLMAMTAASAGAKDLTMPDPDDARAGFDEWLLKEPTATDIEKRELMAVMGVA